MTLNRGREPEGEVDMVCATYLPTVSGCPGSGLSRARFILFCIAGVMRRSIHSAQREVTRFFGITSEKFARVTRGNPARIAR